MAAKFWISELQLSRGVTAAARRRGARLSPLVFSAGRAAARPAAGRTAARPAAGRAGGRPELRVLCEGGGRGGPNHVDLNPDLE